MKRITEQKRKCQTKKYSVCTKYLVNPKENDTSEERKGKSNDTKVGNDRESTKSTSTTSTTLENKK